MNTNKTELANKTKAHIKTQKISNGPYKGQCLCGAISYEVDTISGEIGHCHCNMCQKFHGAAFSTFAETQSQYFRWLAGEEHLKTYQASNGTQRQFCDCCGSSLIFKGRNNKNECIEFTLATLDTAPSLPKIPQPNAHIYMASCAKWFKVNDALPQFSQGRDSALHEN